MKRKFLVTSSELGERMKCTKCNHENSDETKFCESCGERLQAKCSECGALNSAKTKFCEKCGHKLATDGTPKAPGPAPLPIATKPLVERKPAKPEPAAVVPLTPVQPAAQALAKPASPVNAASATVAQPSAKHAASVLQNTPIDNNTSAPSQKTEQKIYLLIVVQLQVKSRTQKK